MEQKKISIITVVYNDVSNIEKTINSVINQDYSNIELIVIDGKSTDGTLKKLEKFEKNIDVLVSEVDNGIYDAMNKGIKIASGDYICFMNSNDTFFSTNVLSDINFDDVTSDIIYGNNLNIFPLKEVFYKPIPLKQFWKSIPFCHQATFVKSQLYKNNPFSMNYPISSVYDFFYKLYIKGYSFEYKDIIICNYDMQGLSSYSLLWLKDYIKISMKYSKGKRHLVFFRIFRLFLSRLKWFCEIKLLKK